MKIKKLLIITFMAFILAGCEVSLTFKSDGDIIEKGIDKISYLYNNCMTDLEGLDEVMTPEARESMDKTCKTSIKTMKKIKSIIENIQNKVGENQQISKILEQINTAINSLENGTSEMNSLYSQLQNGVNQPNFLDTYNNIIENMRGNTVLQDLKKSKKDLNLDQE